MHTKNIEKLGEILEDIYQKFSGFCVILLAGDFNLPGIKWQTQQIKDDCQYKHLHR